MDPSDEIVKAVISQTRTIEATPQTPKHISITVRIKLAWWLRPYLYALACFCWVHGTQPNPDKLRRVLSRGITVKTVLKGSHP